MAIIKISELRASGGGGGFSGGVSIEGNGVVAKGSTTTYFITNYDSFSVYSVSSDVGSATISGDTITLTLPSVMSQTAVILTLTKDGADKVYSIAVGSSVVNTPSITSPSNGSSSQSTNITITATPYATSPAGNGTLSKSEWTVSRDTNHTDVVASGQVTVGDKTRWTVSGLPLDTKLYVRVRYTSTTLGVSSWSKNSSFTTIGVRVNKPTVVFNELNFDVGEQPIFGTDSFSTTPAGMDSHLSSSWRIGKEVGGDIVWSLNRTISGKNQIEVPRGFLETATKYYVQVKFEGSVVGESPWSDPLPFTTANSFIPDVVGTPFGGGFYAGRIKVKNKVYAIVVGSKAIGGQSPTTLVWNNTQKISNPNSSRNDCVANMEAIKSAGIDSHPAAKWCTTYRGGGFDDWLLPSLDVLEVLYRNFKPLNVNNYTASSENPDGSNGINPNSVPVGSAYTTTNPAQTSIDVFKSGGAEDFDGEYYWTSTEYNATNSYNQNFSLAAAAGLQYNGSNKGHTHYVRPVRIVPID